MKKIYLAGGWFTPEMEEEHDRIFTTLVANNYDVFNPRIESLITNESTEDDMSQTLIQNIEGIKNADIIVVIYDRKDTGTIWEAGCAYAYNKPIIYYAETLGYKPFNLMLAKTGRFASDENKLIELLNDEESYKFKSVYNDFKGDVE